MRRISTLLIWCWFLGLALFLFWGCAGTRPHPVEMAVVPPPVEPAAEVKIPVVPAGLDTAFVVELDDRYGALLDDGSLAELSEEAEVLAARAQTVDTLASVIRFVGVTAGRAAENTLSHSDSLVVGRLFLKALASEQPGEFETRTADRLDDAVAALAGLISTVDSLETQLRWTRDGAQASSVARRLREGLFVFTEEGARLHTQLREILPSSAAASLGDSATAFGAMMARLEQYSVGLGNSINEIGRLAEGISTESLLSVEALRGLEADLSRRRRSLEDFRLVWRQFVASGGLDLSGPADRAGDMTAVLERIDSGFADLADGAAKMAAVWDTASTLESQFVAGEDAYVFVADMLDGLAELKQDLGSVVDRYAAEGNRYWTRRQQQEQGFRRAHDSLLAEMDRFLEQHEDVGRIRASEDLVVAYTRLSDAVIGDWRVFVDRVAAHDDRRWRAAGALAAALDARARVLGDARDYAAARTAWENLIAEVPGDHRAWFSLGDSYCAESAEARARPIVRHLRSTALEAFDDCEAILLSRFEARATLDTTRSVLLGESGTPVAEILPLRDFPLPAADYHYKPFFDRARRELEATGRPVSDPEFRHWLRALDDRRRNLAFAANDGDAYFHRLARWILLDTETGSDEELLASLAYWSWDDGHLALIKRSASVSAMADSTVELAQVKRDSIGAVLAGARSVGAQRRLGLDLALLEFQKLDQWDSAIERLHTIMADMAERPNPDPEVGAIDSTIAHDFPILLFNRAGFYEQQGANSEAFYCFLGAARRNGGDPVLEVESRYNAARLLADGNRRGALQLVDESIDQACRILAGDPEAFSAENLIAMFELQMKLAGELRLTARGLEARRRLNALRSAITGDVGQGASETGARLASGAAEGRMQP